MCGVFGIYGHAEAANLAYLGLHALQHRGQESAGIVSAHEGRLLSHRGVGLVQSVFSPTELAALPGASAIGHVRYSTSGGSHLKNAQPIAVDYARGSIAVAHNGNLTNHELIRERLESEGSIFQSGSDTESIVHLIAKSTQREVSRRVAAALAQVEGAYSIVCLTDRELIAVRDPMGFRPLCLGVLEVPATGEQPARRAFVVASEPVAFELIGARLVRDIEPGELVVIDDHGLRSERPFDEAPRRMCLFEYIYFARPDSVLGGASVYEVRKALGRALASEHPIEGASAADTVVVPVPDSGVPAAIGYAEAAGLPFDLGLIRSHYVGRTFIEPQQSIRHFGVRLKLNPNRAVLEGKRVIVVDDSIVRGTTSRKIVKMVRDAGATEVHLRVSSPPTAWPCYYGIDTPTRSELIASNHTVEEISRHITATSLGYLSLKGLVRAVGALEQPRQEGERYCHACFSGQYPVAFTPASELVRLRRVE